MQSSKKKIGKAQVTRESEKGYDVNLNKRLKQRSQSAKRISNPGSIT